MCFREIELFMLALCMCVQALVLQKPMLEPWTMWAKDAQARHNLI
jgi:hypothetical protein